MSLETIWNLLLTGAIAVIGWLLRGFHDIVASLQKEDRVLSDKVQQIALLVAGDYVKKSDMQLFKDEILARFDKLEEFLRQ